MTNGNRVLVKIFIDGQNFYNRIKDFDLHVSHIDYPRFFNYILDQIKPNFSPHYNVELLKAEWFTTGSLYKKQYPWEKMKIKHLSHFFDGPNDPKLRRLAKLKTDHPNFEEKYKNAFYKEKGKDHQVANSYARGLKTHIKSLNKIKDRYTEKGLQFNGKQLDLIYIKYCGFLKMHFESRSATEKGVDVAIASQMLCSILDTSKLQQRVDKDDVIPDYNSDVLVLVSTDMDFIEPLRILHTMGKTVYMVHIQKRLVENLQTNDLCHPILINKKRLSSFIIRN